MKHDNYLLVDFEFLINMDLAMFYYVKENFAKSPYVNKRIISSSNEEEINTLLLYRPHINPLEVLIPKMDTESMYNDLMDNYEEELLKHAKAYDTFGLMITYLNLASVDIDVLCKNALEVQYINSLNKRLHCVEIPDKASIDLKPYSVIYSKYFSKLLEFPVINGKNIFIAAAGFNMEEDTDCVNKNLTLIFTRSNEVRLIDLYRNMKFRFDREDS